MPYVTYIAPEGDSEVVHYLGVKFFSGLAVEVDASETRLLAKAASNPHFDVSDDDDDDDDAPSPGAGDEGPKRRGRPPKIKPAGNE